MILRRITEVVICGGAAGVALTWYLGDDQTLVFAGLVAVIGVVLTAIYLAIYRNWWMSLALMVFAWPAYAVSMLFYQCSKGNCL